jgi:hypothetical protein
MLFFIYIHIIPANNLTFSNKNQKIPKVVDGKFQLLTKAQFFVNSCYRHEICFLAFEPVGC